MERPHLNLRTHDEQARFQKLHMLVEALLDPRMYKPPKGVHISAWEEEHGIKLNRTPNWRSDYREWLEKYLEVTDYTQVGPYFDTSGQKSTSELIKKTNQPYIYWLVYRQHRKDSHVTDVVVYLYRDDPNNPLYSQQSLQREIKRVGGNFFQS